MTKSEIDYQWYIADYCRTPVELWSIGKSNWDLYLDEHGLLYSIPKPDKIRIGCQATTFGTTSYVERFENRFGFKCGFTRISDGKEF